MPIFRRPLMHVRRMAVFFRELHSLSRAGVTLTSAFRELSQRAPANLRGLAREMGAAVEAGQPLHTVMERHRDLFYAWHVGLVRAAEASGDLPEALDHIARAYEVEWETRAALLSRLFFYTFLVLPGVLLVIPLLLMLNQPIPKEGWTPPEVIATVLHYLRTVSLPIVAGLIAVVLIWQALSATAWFQGVQQRILLRLPLAGRVARATALDRYLGTLGLLLRAGIPAAEAAEQAAGSAGNPALTRRLLAVAAAVREGIPVSAALEGTGLLDPDTLGMAATGELSGSLPEMLARAAGYYREEHEAKRRRLLLLAGVGLSVVYLALVGALFVIAARSYFDFLFRGLDWMLE